MCSSGTQCSEDLVGEREVCWREDEGKLGNLPFIPWARHALLTVHTPTIPGSPGQALLPQPHPPGTTSCLPSVQATGNKQGGKSEGWLEGLSGEGLAADTPPALLCYLKLPAASLADSRKTRQAWKPLRSSGQGEPQLPLGNPGGRTQGKFYFYKVKLYFTEV